MDDGHHILELVPEPVGPSRLVDGRPPPDPARKGLVDEPSVRQDIESFVGGPDGHGVGSFRPELPYSVKGGPGGEGVGEAGQKGFGLLGIPSRPEAEDDLLLLSRCERKFDLQGSAGVEACPDPPRQAGALHGRRGLH